MNATTLTCYETHYSYTWQNVGPAPVGCQKSDIKFQQTSESKPCLDLQAVNRKLVSGMFSSFHVGFPT